MSEDAISQETRDKMALREQGHEHRIEYFRLIFSYFRWVLPIVIGIWKAGEIATSL